MGANDKKKQPASSTKSSSASATRRCTLVLAALARGPGTAARLKRRRVLSLFVEVRNLLSISWTSSATTLSSADEWWKTLSGSRTTRRRVYERMARAWATTKTKRFALVYITTDTTGLAATKKVLAALALALAQENKPNIRKRISIINQSTICFFPFNPSRCSLISQVSFKVGEENRNVATACLVTQGWIASSSPYSHLDFALMGTM